jgi:CRP-like cAMP-binding protein
MKIEKEILHFHPQFKAEQVQLNQLQSQYLGILMQNSSLQSTVEFFLKQGWLVSFRELYALMDYLVSNGIVLNHNLITYFQDLKPESEAHFLSRFLPFSVKASPQYDLQSFRELPFFRSLEPQLSGFLLKSARIVRVPAKNFICRSGDKSRDLYVVLKGRAGIYKSNAKGQVQLVAQLSEQSVFGEAGFFLNQARSADIVTLEETDLLVIPSHPDMEKYLDKNKAQGLQLRFWVQHALQNSELFKNFPSDCLDALGFSGQLTRTLPQQLLFREGERGHAAYIVVQGSLSVLQRGRLINTMEQGSFFGEISLLVSGGVRTATIQAQQESLLIEIPQSEFYRLLSQNLFLAKELETLAHERLLKDQSRHLAKKI